MQQQESSRAVLLPADVIAALQQGQKITAIKQLRLHSGLGLKEAKEAVEDYERAHPEIAVQKTGSGLAGLFWFIALVLIAVSYYYLRPI